MRPGKPLAFGRRGHQRVFGLPGNPVSSLVSFTLFVAPALRRLQGLAHATPRAVRAVLTGRGERKKQGLTVFSRARVHLDDDGRFACELSPKTSSGQVSGIAWANALCVIPADGDGVEPGALVDAILLDDSMLLR